MAEPEAAQLLPHGGDVRLGRDARVGAGLHGVLLGRQPEGVVAERMKYVGPRHALEARVDVRPDVAEGMTDVEARPGRIREHVHHEEARAIGDLGEPRRE